MIRPDWPVPGHVRAVSTTRTGGSSNAPYAELNLGIHVGDDAENVAANRAALVRAAGIDTQPGWLDQVHGTVVADFDAADPDKHRVAPTADASITRRPGRVCVVMTADCLPILLTDAAGTAVAAAHGGWRGLAAGVLEATIAAFRDRGVDAGDLLAWFGPAIGAAAYEVDQVVAGSLSPDDAGALIPGRAGHWQLDLYELARLRLARAGVERVYGGDLCTHSDSARFYSYRRDGATGRQATLIWMAENT
ncbi:MAG: peptidoglycan editing factor PgeF [Gammaproteobacteria bacterium]